MRQVAPVLARAGTLGAAVVVLTLLPITSEDALGLGLLAFAGLVLVSGAWALVDGYRHGVRTPLLWWTLTAGVLGVGWWFLSAATRSDASMSFTEALAADPFFIVFVVVLVLVPAAVGALVGGGLGRARRG